jgi:hypothetical protein
LGARLLPLVPEQARRLPQGDLERDQLERSCRPFVTFGTDSKATLQAAVWLFIAATQPAMAAIALKNSKYYLLHSGWLLPSPLF